VSAPPPSVLQGETFRVADTTLNEGSAASPATRTFFYLSRDKNKSGSDVKLTPGRSVIALEAGAERKGSKNVTVPANTASGPYFLIGCADDLGAAAETDEGDNCLSSTLKVWVVEPGWLGYVNYFRSLAGVAPAVENDDFSAADLLHAQYMVGRDQLTHDETPGAFYTPAGDEAAANSNVMASSNSATDDLHAIDVWMTGPFHALAVIDPQLLETGFGSARDAEGSIRMAAALNVLQGLGDTPGSVEFPVLFPGASARTPFRTFQGNELPDPLLYCPGYTAPTGAPILMQMGEGNYPGGGNDVDVNVDIQSVKLTRGSEQLQVCVFDEKTTGQGQGSLRNRDAIVILPKDPLVAGGRYKVEVKVNGVLYKWSFYVNDDAT
jgi:hypothetical protein